MVRKEMALEKEVVEGTANCLPYFISLPPANNRNLWFVNWAYGPLTSYHVLRCRHATKLYPLEEEKKSFVQPQGHIHKWDVLIGHLPFPFPTNWKKDLMVLGHLCPCGRGHHPRKQDNTRSLGLIRRCSVDLPSSSGWLGSLDFCGRDEQIFYPVHIASVSFLKHLTQHPT